MFNLSRKHIDQQDYVIKSNLTEKQIEADVAQYISWRRPFGEQAPLRLIDVNEAKTGADKLINIPDTNSTKAIAIYMQFKKSTGLKSLDDIPSAKKPSKLELIRKYRKDKELNDSPTLFFELRKKTANQADFHHNVLRNYHSPKDSYAVYIAPLLTDSSHYFEMLHTDRQQTAPCFFCRHSHEPFDFNDQRVQRSLDDVIFQFAHTPFLNAHVSIPPHDRVQSADHHYAFGANGFDVSFHSESKEIIGDKRLSSFMASIYRDCYDNEGTMLSLDELASRISQKAERIGYKSSFRSNDLKPMKWLREHGTWLFENFDIRQFILIRS